MLWEGGGRCCESAEEEKIQVGQKKESSVNHQWRRNKVEAVGAGRVCGLCAWERELKDGGGTLRRRLFGTPVMIWRQDLSSI